MRNEKIVITHESKGDWDWEPIDHQQLFFKIIVVVGNRKTTTFQYTTTHARRGQQIAV